MKVSLTTANGARGVSVDALKRALRIEGDTSQDTLLGELLDARQRWAEKLAGVSVLEATWTATWDRDDLGAGPGIAREERSGWVGLRLPLRPVTDVTTVKVTDSEHAQTTVAAEDYVLAIDADGAAVLYLNSDVWSASLRETACIEVVFVAGWEADDIPQALIKGITVGAAHDYESPDEPACQAAEQAAATERPVRLA